MPQEGRIVGIDVAKRKVDACIRSLQQRLSKPGTPEGEAELTAWLHDNGVGLAVMEASGGYERPSAEVLRRAGIECASSIPNGCAILPNRPESWPRTTRSMPR